MATKTALEFGMHLAEVQSRYNGAPCGCIASEVIWDEEKNICRAVRGTEKPCTGTMKVNAETQERWEYCNVAAEGQPKKGDYIQIKRYRVRVKCQHCGAGHGYKWFIEPFRPYYGNYDIPF